MPASPRQKAHGQSQRSGRRVVDRRVAVGPVDARGSRRPGRRGSRVGVVGRSPDVDRLAALSRVDGSHRVVIDSPGPSARARRRGSRAILGRREPRDRPRHKRFGDDRRPRRPDVRGRRAARSSASSARTAPARRRRCGSPRHPRAPTPARSAGTAPTRRACRGGRGATCPRSAASTRGWRVLDQLVYFAVALRRCRPTSPGARRSHWLRALPRSRTTPTAAPRSSRRATSRRSSSSPRSSTTREVLLMDEPFTGLDPVNLALLREAFLELRDRGRTLIFSTHQMETVEALCESVAIVDHGRLVVGGHARATLKRAQRAGGCVRLVGRRRPPAAVARRPCPGSRILRPGVGRTELELDAGRRARRASSRRRSRRGAPVTPLRGRRAVARADLHRARRPAGRCEDDADPARRRGAIATPRPATARGRRVSRRRPMPTATSPLFPNAGHRRPARVPRARPGAALPRLDAHPRVLAIARRAAADRGQARSTAAATTTDRGRRRRSGARRPDRGDVLTGDPQQSARQRVRARRRRPTSRRAIARRRRPPARRRGRRRRASRTASSRSASTLGETMGSAGRASSRSAMFGVAVLDYAGAATAASAASSCPTLDVAPVRRRRADGGASRSTPSDVREPADRRGGVRGPDLHHDRDLRDVGRDGRRRREGSRVMELLISAASPRQLVIGKALGIGLAGADPVRRSSLVPGAPRARRPGPDRRGRPRARASGSRRPLVGAVARRCSLAFGVFFLLGFALYSLDLRGGGLAREPARGPPDPRPAAEPRRDRRLPDGDLLALTGGITGFIRLASYVAVLEPVRDARPAHRSGGSSRGSSCCRSGCCVATIAVVAVVAIRIYAAGRAAVRPAARASRARSWRRPRAAADARRCRSASRPARSAPHSSKSSGSRRISARTGAAPRSGPRRRPRRRPGASRRPGRRRDEPPQPAADARAGTGSTAGGPASRRSPGRRPPRTAPGPRSAIAGTATTSSPGPQDPPERSRRRTSGWREQRPPVEVEQVEGEERDRPARLAAPAAGQLAGVGPAGGIDDDQLAVEDRRPGRDPDGQPGQLGQRRGRRRARRHRRTATSPPPATLGRPDRRERPLAAPPRLEQVLVGVERLRRGARQHRPQVREIRAGPESGSSRSESWSAIVARW